MNRNHAKKNEAESKGNTNKKSQSSCSEDGNDTDTNKTKKKADKKKGECLQTAFAALAAFSTAVLAVIAVVGVVFTREQAKASKLDRRAWVGVSRMIKIEKNERPAGIQIGIKNTGKTPAKKGYAIYVLQVGPTPDYAPNTKMEEISNLVISPQQEIFLNLRTKPEHEQLIQAVVDGKTTLFALGKVDYDDIFGIRHWFKFCVYYDTLLKEYNAYKEYNDTGTYD